MDVPRAFWMTTVALVVGGSALAIDLGIARVSRAHLQTALDAATLSGVQDLDGTAEVITCAGATTIDYAYRNVALYGPLFLEESEVEVGTWDAATRTFAAWSSGDPRFVNAVRARHTNPPLGLTLAELAPTARWFRVEAESIAILDARSEPR